MKKIALWLTFAIAVAAPLASRVQAQDDGKAAATKHFKLAGTVKSVDAKGHKLVVDHGDIPGFMAAMTMPYEARKEEDLQKVAVGDQIQADVVVNSGAAHLENIKVTGHAKGKDAK
jgi:protein SCO1/2